MDTDTQTETEKRPVTLILVEDKKIIHETFVTQCRRRYGDKVRVIVATRLADALRETQENAGRFDAILMDGCVDHLDDLDSPPLIRQIRAEGYKGPIIAHSSSDWNRARMMEAGASHSCDKHEMIATVFGIVKVE